MGHIIVCLSFYPFLGAVSQGPWQNELTASAGGEVSFIVWVVDSEHWFGALCFWDEASESP